VKTVLAELLVATSLLTATLKFAGDITVQLQGDGPLLAVINGNNQQQMRGVARVQGEIAEDADLKTLVGNGYLVITISRKRVSAIRAWSVWKAIRWRPAWKITSSVQNSCRRALSSAPANMKVSRWRAACCCR
jgi:molecular chaperone Hsp33